MALAIDASTPAPTAIAGGGQTSQATGTFTVPSSSVVVVLVACDSGSTTVAISVSGMTGAGLTWAQISGAQVHAKAFPSGGTFGLVEAWYASAPSGWTTQAITATFSEAVANTSGNIGIVQPIVFTGAATTQNGAVGTVSSSAPSQAVTTTANGSWVLAAGDTNAGNTAPTAGTAQTTTINGNLSVETGTGINGAWWAQQQNAVTATSGTSVTMNDTAPTGSTNFLVVEILASGGVVAPTFTGFIPSRMPLGA